MTVQDTYAGGDVIRDSAGYLHWRGCGKVQCRILTLAEMR